MQWYTTKTAAQSSRKWHDIQNEMKLKEMCDIQNRFEMHSSANANILYKQRSSFYGFLFCISIYFRRVSSVDRDLSVSFFNSSRNWYYLFASFLRWECDKQAFCFSFFLSFLSFSVYISIYSSKNMKWFCFWKLGVCNLCKFIEIVYSV